MTYTRPQLTWQMTNNIVANLSGDSDTLASCSLVSKTWMRRARLYMFRQIHILGEDKLQLYLDLITRPNTLLFRSAAYELHVQSPNRTSGAARMKIHYRELVRLLSRLPLLSHFSLRDVIILHDDLDAAATLSDWAWGPRHIRNLSLVNVTDENNILSKRRLGSILHLFNAVDNLYVLWSGQEVTIPTDADSRAVTKFKHLPRISGLNIPAMMSATAGLLRCLMQMDACALLTTLNVDISDRDMLAALGNMLRTSGQSLKTVRIFLAASQDLMKLSADDVATRLNLANCTSASTMDFGLTLTDDDATGTTATHLRWQWDAGMAMLQRLPQDTVRTIHMTISPRCAKLQNVFYRLADVPWAQFYTIARRFPALTDVAVACPSIGDEQIAQSAFALCALAMCGLGKDVTLTWKELQHGGCA